MRADFHPDPGVHGLAAPVTARRAGRLPNRTAVADESVGGLRAVGRGALRRSRLAAHPTKSHAETQSGICLRLCVRFLIEPDRRSCFPSILLGGMIGASTRSSRKHPTMVSASRP